MRRLYYDKRDGESAIILHTAQQQPQDNAHTHARLVHFSGYCVLFPHCILHVESVFHPLTLSLHGARSSAAAKDSYRSGCDIVASEMLDCQFVDRFRKRLQLVIEEEEEEDKR
jgi:hypothetical protein